MKNFLFVLLLLFLAACHKKEGPGLFTIATHNAYCFFDGYSCGIELYGFRAEDGYDAECYERRVKDYADFLCKHYADADVILFQEIENSIVLKDLLEAGLGRKGYQYYGSGAYEEGYFATGFISKLKPEEVLFHGAEGSRLIMELVFTVDGEKLHLFNIHASSRLSEENDIKRESEVALLRSLIDSLEGELSIAMGDFNTDLKTGDGIIAIKGSVESLESPLAITGDGGECKSGVYYCPWADLMATLGKGTYFHDGEWGAFDGALISDEAFDWQGLEYLGSRVIAPFDAIDPYGRPRPFSVSSKSGISDHLGFQVTLEIEN